MLFSPQGILHRSMSDLSAPSVVEQINPKIPVAPGDDRHMRGCGDGDVGVGLVCGTRWLGVQRVWARDSLQNRPDNGLKYVVPCIPLLSTIPPPPGPS